MRMKAAVAIVALGAVSLAAQQPVMETVPNCAELATALTSVLRNDVRLRDWPNLARYREQNRQLAAAPPGQARVVFMGDSITDLWPQPRFGDFFTDKPYVGRGISGQTTPQMLIRFRPDVIDLKPKAVVILAGTNDIAGNTGPMTDEDIQNNLAAIAELASAHGVKVVLASILPTSDHHYQPERGGPPQTSRRPLERINGLNRWLRDYAASHGHVYLDYYSAVVDANGMLKAEFSEDDLHPNARAYAVMAPLAEAAIAQALK